MVPCASSQCNNVYDHITYCKTFFFLWFGHSRALIAQSKQLLTCLRTYSIWINGWNVHLLWIQVRDQRSLPRNTRKRPNLNQGSKVKTMFYMDSLLLLQTHRSLSASGLKLKCLLKGTYSNKLHFFVIYKLYIVIYNIFDFVFIYLFILLIYFQGNILFIFMINLSYNEENACRHFADKCRRSYSRKVVHYVLLMEE